MINHYDIENIRICAEKVLVDRKMPKADATLFVDSMLSADMCGVSTHGIKMLISYVHKIDKGELSFEHPIVVKQLPSFSVIDANNSIGAVSAAYAADLAIEKAKQYGIHTVFSRNSNTFGPGFYYSERIANAGMIGFVCSNSPAAMPAFNGLEVMLGTNPLAFSAPTKSYGNIVMDMATSVVAKSKFLTAKAKGDKLEPGWALDKNGNPTTDPDEGIQGFVLPMAGFKGYGLAMMIDIMSGFLSGAGYLNTVGKFYSQTGDCMNVGHMITAFNPELICDGDYLAEADKYIERIKRSKHRENNDIIVPGEDRKSRKKDAMENGITLTPDVVKQLESLFQTNLVLTNEGNSII